MDKRNGWEVVCAGERGPTHFISSWIVFRLLCKLFKSFRLQTHKYAFCKSWFILYSFYFTTIIHSLHSHYSYVFRSGLSGPLARDYQSYKSAGPVLSSSVHHWSTNNNNNYVTSSKVVLGLVVPLNIFTLNDIHSGYCVGLRWNIWEIILAASSIQLSKLI